jgi:hypothetical protein
MRLQDLEDLTLGALLQLPDCLTGLLQEEEAR